MKFSNLKLFSSVIVLLMMNGGISFAQNGTVTVNQDPQIDALLLLKKDVNRNTKMFKIQIYNGSRTGAEYARNEFRRYYSSWPVSMTYETPNYKIWVGNFRSRIEADRALKKIKRKYIKAFIFMPKKYKK